MDLEKDTLIDLIVNLIPIVMLAFFSFMFVVFNPWEFDLFTAAMTHFLTLFPLVVLVLVTYVSGRIIQRDEGQSA
jgi:hypothetical protein